METQRELGTTRCCALAAAARRRMCPRSSGRASRSPPPPQPTSPPPPPPPWKSSPPSAKVAPFFILLICGISSNGCRGRLIPAASRVVSLAARSSLQSSAVARACACGKTARVVGRCAEKMAWTGRAWRWRGGECRPHDADLFGEMPK